MTIPIIPVPKARHRTARLPNGKTIGYNDSKARGDIEKFITYARPYFPEKPLDGALSAYINVFLPIPNSWPLKKKTAAINGIIMPMTSRSDIDNYCKMALDCLNGQMFVDDHQICRLMAEKHYSAAPRWEIEICQLPTS